MIRFFITILIVNALYSCSGTSIPEEVELRADSRQIVADFCGCLENGETQMECIQSLRKRFKSELLSVHDEDRKKYIKDVAHSLIESECLADQFNGTDVNAILQSLVNE